MAKLESGKSLFYINLIGTIYFSYIVILMYLNIDTEATSMINEIFTTLFLLLGVVVIVYTIKVFKNDQYKLYTYSFWAVVMVIINILIFLIIYL